MKYIMTGLGMFVMVFTCLVASSAWQGFVLTKVWGWFVVPSFGLTTLSIPVAIGLVCTMRLLTGLYNQATVFDKDDSKEDTFGKAIGVMFIAPLILLVIAWVATWFV